MRKILLSGEGPTDCGKRIYGTVEWSDGPVQHIIRKFIHPDDQINTIDKKDIFLLRRSRRNIKICLDGHALKAYFLCLKAEMGDFDYVCCYVDADFQRDDGTKEQLIKHKFHTVYRQINEGFDLFKINHNHFKECTVPIVPVTMIESWLMGDIDVFSRLFKGLSSTSFPTKPERLWGSKDDPDSQYPKHVLSRILSGYGESCCQDTFNQIAYALSIDALTQSCDISFRPFSQDMKQVFSD